MIVDVGGVMDAIKADKALWLVRDIYDIEGIVEALIEEPLSPREYPDIMDTVSDRVDKSSQLREIIEDDELERMSMMLEIYQLQIDNIITRNLPSPEKSISYEVTRWLSPTTIIVSINPDTKHLR